MEMTDAGEVRPLELLRGAEPTGAEHVDLHELPEALPEETPDEVTPEAS